jgi:hypothetical protein
MTRNKHWIVREYEKRAGASADTFVPDVVVCDEFGVTSMTLWRWDHDAELGFPPKIKIGAHNFRSRKALEEFKKRMQRTAIEQRSKESRRRSRRAA